MNRSKKFKTIETQICKMRREQKLIKENILELRSRVKKAKAQALKIETSANALEEMEGVIDSIYPRRKEGWNCGGWSGCLYKKYNWIKLYEAKSFVELVEQMHKDWLLKNEEV